ncbi:zinc finger BED domain-containing protein RICESLEEPER 2-like [Rhizophagus clarus]|uniref:Zinc finger BED domain-containing protein RICESLEEPER 2-like n=1 Tax=Rhizophagus clarus TaxID=94130 RepID=A0A8H3QIJ4_9GLOM|nr:zinc finger BED domain-containing protein RICESLEEPER 2-like [Rhizophagus clarus]
MAEETEEQNDYETFPFDSFIEIVDDSHEDVPEILHEENEETITEAETEITEKSKPYHSKIWEYFEKISEEEEDNIKNYIICNLYQLHLLANNSTTTLEWHLKAKHKVDYDTYKSNVEVKQLGFWATELQQEKYKLFINWIITDQQRFTVVENKNFRKFLSSIQLRYKLPTRHTVKSIIMNKFKDAQKQINNYLQLSTSKISLTIDMWTSITSLDVLYIPSPHNAISIKNAIIEVVTELKIENRLICITIVGAAFNTNIIPESVKKLRTFISTVRNSPKQMDKLKEYFRIEEIKFKAPFQIALHANLKSNLKTLSDNWPTDEEWEILTELANLLALFASITKVISASNYPTIGEIKLLFSGLKAHLNKFQDDNYILQEQLNEMNNVFNNYFDEINKALHIPAFFDSCYKNLSFESDQTPQPVVNELDIYFDSNPPGDEIDPLE